MKTTFWIILLLFLDFGMGLCAQVKNGDDKLPFAEIRRPYKTVSPIITHLLKVQGELLQKEVEKFWARAENEGLPLIHK